MIPPTRAIRSSDLQLYSDASDKGYGATYGNSWIQGAWNSHESALSIDYRELFAISAATFTWGHRWKGQRIVFITDNKPITQIWDKGTSPSIPIMTLIRPLYLFAACKGFSISFKHIYGIYNVAADALSRFQMDVFRATMPDADALPTPVPTTVPAYQGSPPSKRSKRKHQP